MSTTVLLLLGAGALFLALGRRADKQEQIGRIKRRIYKEVSLAQKAGVDFSKKFGQLTDDEITVLESVATDAGWKQSKRSREAGKTFAESYYGSLLRAWNAVSGCKGVGTAYDVKDAEGNVVLTWIEDAAEHVKHERDMQDALRAAEKERRARNRKKREFDRYVQQHGAYEAMRKYNPEQLPPSDPVPEPASEVTEQIQVTEETTEPAAPVTPTRKPRSSKAAAKEAERAERAAFAKEFLNKLADEGFDSFLNHPANLDNSETRAGEKLLVGDLYAEAFALNKLKTRKSDEAVYFGNIPEYGWIKDMSQTVYIVAERLLQAWKEHEIDKQFAREDLNDIRRELLDKAKHMDVYITRDGAKEVTDYDYSGKPYQRNVPNIITARGDERYNHLDKINWIAVKSSHADPYGRGVEVYYPIRAFADKLDAESFAKPRGARVVQVTDVKMNAISGLPVE